MRITHSVVGVAILVTAALSASAQMVVDRNRSTLSPDGQFGIGFNNHGGHVQYAFGPALHVGLSLSLEYYRETDYNDTYYNFGPYVKYLFSGELLKPYARAGSTVAMPRPYEPPLPFHTLPIAYPPDDAELRLFLSVGAEHFFNESVGVYGHVDLVNAKLVPDPTALGFGLQGGTAGLEFFF